MSDTEARGGQELDVPPAGSEANAAAGGAPYGKIAIGVVALLAAAILARQAGGYLPAVAQWVESLGFWGPFAFILIYAAGVVAFVPGILLTPIGGAIFGLVEGSIYVFIAAVIGSTAAFLIARYGARKAIERKIADYPKFASVDRAVGEQGLKIMLLVRLSPAFPFNFLNYALGLTGVTLRDYVFASLGMIPATILYVYFGTLIGDVAAIAGGAETDKDTAYYAVRVLGLLATIVVTALVTRVARRALKEATAEA